MTIWGEWMLWLIISWGYLIFPFVSKMLLGNLQNLKGLFPQIYCSAIYSEKQRSILVRSRRRSRASQPLGDIKRYSVQTSSSRFQKKNLKVGLIKQHNQDIKDVNYNKQNQKKKKCTSQTPWRKWGGWTVSDPSSPNKSDKCKFAIKLKTELSILQINPSAFFPPKTSLSTLRGDIHLRQKHHTVSLSSQTTIKKTPQLLIYRSNLACKKCRDIKYIVRIHI